MLVKIADAQKTAERLTVAERDAFREVSQVLDTMRQPEQRLTRGMLMLIAQACAKSWGRRESDKRTDHARRVTVGARVKREFGEECQACALATGRSMYRFVHDALEREVQACKNGTNVLLSREEVKM